MRPSKLDISYLDLTTLKNQIRAELNHVRPKKNIQHKAELPENKKMFVQKHMPTNIFHPHD